VVLVHGSLDRGESFRRVARRLTDRRVVFYDRRGYQGSRDLGPGGVLDHAADLVDLMASFDAGPGGVVPVGHSLGGDVALAAALARPDLVGAVAAWEPPMPWLGFRRPGAAPRAWPPLAEDPGQEAERFFRRMVGDAAWDRLPEPGRSARRADGPALVADLRSLRGDPPFDVTALAVPLVAGRGGPDSAPHHRATVAWLAEHVPGCVLFEIDGAAHGAHLTHPDRFAEFVRLALALASARVVTGGP
jgi:pimeloyl-ACP methyl ester carboxylesterase